MDLLVFILFLAGTICLGLAAFSVGFTNRIQIGWLGLFLWALSLLIPMFGTL